MKKSMLQFTKSILEQVSFDSVLFCKEVVKASKILLPYEFEELSQWLQQFTQDRPELQQYQVILNQ